MINLTNIISVVGQWDYVGVSGVSSMHGILAPGTNKVIFIGRVEKETQVKLNGKYAYSTEYDLDTNTIRPLSVRTNTFCSAGSYLPNGTLINLGGAEATQGVPSGYNKIRSFTPCDDGSCDWVESEISLVANRWYPTVEQLADGTLFIIAGSVKGVYVNNETVNVPSFETYPPSPQGVVQFDFLVETLPYNLYPMVHLLPDKNLFILANTRAIIFDTNTWSIKNRLPDIPGVPRNYPLTGASVLLPLSPENDWNPEILVCGGANKLNRNASGDHTCGRIKPLSDSPTWEMDTMPFGRVMPDMTLLANGELMILNGCNQGTAGFTKCSDPTLTPVIYDYTRKIGSRFKKMQPSYIPRMYHSIGFTVPSGQVLVSGSNPNRKPLIDGPYPTEYRVELFSPTYMFTGNPRPLIVNAPGSVSYGQNFVINIITYRKKPKIKANILNSGFVSHSTHMSQRLVWLTAKLVSVGKVKLTAPPAGGVAPPGPYLLFIVEDGVPSKAVWIKVGLEEKHG
ncbi:hypothetical protein G9A89_014127 [Geosiphon pyriformis]|nr:hypothetical protein G9A89_014127 [Geosiphon pyriformis]